MPIQRLRVGNFKSFERADLAIGPFTILIGANAAHVLASAPGHPVQRPDRAEQARDPPGQWKDWNTRGGSGVGLANICARLAAQFGDRASLALENNELGGATATIALPLATTAGVQ